MSRAMPIPRTAGESLLIAITGVLIVIVVIMVLNGMYQSSATKSPDTGSNEGQQNTRENFILGLAILGIAGTFGLIAYYYRNIDFGSKK